MICWLNGRYLDDSEAVVPLLDRGLLYGDGLFETLRVHNGAPFQWQAHWDRLRSSCDFLQIAVPDEPQAWLTVLRELMARNALQHAVARITITRGVGARGYSPRNASNPTLAMNVFSLSPPPTHWRLATTSRWRIPALGNLERSKHANRLVHVLARMEADEQGADDTLLLTERGLVSETTSANIFWVTAGELRTPALSTHALPGVTRALVLDLASECNIRCAEVESPIDELRSSEGAFATLSTWGIVPIGSVDGQSLGIASQLGSLQAAYAARLTQECPASTPENHPSGAVDLPMVRR